jgi:V/A-type H+-transporting ATPase subunit D
VQRLALARRAAEVIDQKRAVLAEEVTRAAQRAQEAQQEWQRAAAEAERWLGRAVLPGGARGLDLALAFGAGEAQALVSWRSTMGVEAPADAELRLGDPPDLVALGAGSALVLAARAHAVALEAALRFAAAEGARRRLQDELASTVRRLRALERRWIPRHEAALQRLELSLDEMEREEAARLRWLARQAAERPALDVR